MRGRYMQLRRANHWHPHDPMNPWGRCEQCEERCHEDFLLEVEEGDEVRVLCPECAEEAKAGKLRSGRWVMSGGFPPANRTVSLSIYSRKSAFSFVALFGASIPIA